MSKTHKDIKGQPELILLSLEKFYNNEKNIKIILDILKNNKISLRIIDWFVTNYSKKKNIEYCLKKRSPKKNTKKKKKVSKKEKSRNNCNFINIFLSYKNQLNAFSKKHFDPFCRRNRIEFVFSNGEKITTTVGQLNFFKWAIQNNVIDYISENFDEIEKDMNIYTKKNSETTKKSGKISKKRKKRAPLSVAATKSMNINKNITTLSFD